MDESLISKKELLDLTGISYGQLYRWKRKHLIPEEWFIRKATFTGQETFFPKEKILTRLEKIKDLKDDVSLDELADLFSPNPLNISFTGDELLQLRVVSPFILTIFVECEGTKNIFTFENILFMSILDKLFLLEEIHHDEGILLMRTMQQHFHKFNDTNCDLICVRKLGVFTCCLASSAVDIFFETDTNVIARLNVPRCIEELKQTLTL